MREESLPETALNAEGARPKEPVPIMREMA